MGEYFAFLSKLLIFYFVFGLSKNELQNLWFCLTFYTIVQCAFYTFVRVSTAIKFKFLICATNHAQQINIYTLIWLRDCAACMIIKIYSNYSINNFNSRSLYYETRNLDEVYLWVYKGRKKRREVYGLFSRHLSVALIIFRGWSSNLDSRVYIEKNMNIGAFEQDSIVFLNKLQWDNEAEREENNN